MNGSAVDFSKIPFIIIVMLKMNEIDRTRKKRRRYFRWKRWAWPFHRVRVKEVKNKINLSMLLWLASLIRLQHFVSLIDFFPQIIKNKKTKAQKIDIISLLSFFVVFVWLDFLVLFCLLRRKRGQQKCIESIH